MCEQMTLTDVLAETAMDTEFQLYTVGFGLIALSLALLTLVIRRRH